MVRQRFSKNYFLFFLTLLLAIFLRFYGIEDNLVFHGELGHNYLAIKNFLIDGEIPLLGPPTSHPWLSFGPLFYWLFAPVLTLFNFDPVSGAYFSALMAILVVGLNYLVVNRLFNQKVALISSFLIAISPLWLWLTREARFFSLVTLFIYPHIYFLVQRKYFWSAVFLGLMFSFHFSPLFLIPLLFFFAFKEKKRKVVLESLVGLVIPNLTFLIQGFKDNFEMLGQLVIWLPYRIAGFLGLYPKNNLNSLIFNQNLQAIYSFFTESLLAQSDIFLGAILIIILSFYLILKTRTYFSESVKEEQKRTWQIIIGWLGFGLLALFVHGDPPKHYFMPLYPLPPLLFALFLTDLAQKRIGKIFTNLILLLVFLLNLSFFFSDQWFYQDQTRLIQGRPIPYQIQLQTAQEIIQEARGEPFSLSRTGPFDYFEDNYRQNYQYLLWWLGNEPVSEDQLEKGNFKFRIIEDFGQGEVKIEKMEK